MREYILKCKKCGCEYTVKTIGEIINTGRCNQCGNKREIISEKEEEDDNKNNNLKKKGKGV